ncbi:MAG: DNA polymerase III subunit gamma/tau [Bacteroidales bacterium]|nr:DNA polymerase III subunit gamma/tau [Bacteroidales bacterium]
MTDYIVSARKYRPESFETLIGQDNIARTLKNSIQRGQLAHAYLFCGPRGVGKTTTARIFAKMINCSNPSADGEPCGQCESCVSFAEGRSYCIFEMDAASNNSVDDIKDLIDKVRIPPQVGRYSVYIIDEVHMLSTQAFNAFLKTLEEPPEYAIFILATTEKHKILPTILSRCQTYDFNRITVDNIVRNLRDIAGKEGVTIDDESLHVIALKADGAMRDALTIFDQTVAFCGTDVKYADVIRNLNVLDYEYSFSLVENFLSGDYASALRTFDEILSKGFNALHFMSALSSHFRDLLVARAGGVDSLLELAASVKERYRAQAASCSEKFLYDALTATTACEQGYKMAVNPRLHIEFCLMKLCFMNRAATQTAAQPVQTPTTQPTPAAQTTPVVQQAPVVQEAPVQNVRQRGTAGGSGLSLKSLAAREQTQASENVVPEQKEIIPSDDDIVAKWNMIKEEGKGNLRLFNAMDTAKLDLKLQNGRKIVRYCVMNDAQKIWLESLNSRLEAKMRKLLGSSLVDMVVDLQPEDPSEKVAVTPEDKAKEMMEKNPVVRSAIADLGLELK